MQCAHENGCQMTLLRESNGTRKAAIKSLSLSVINRKQSRIGRGSSDKRFECTDNQLVAALLIANRASYQRAGNIAGDAG